MTRQCCVCGMVHEDGEWRHTSQSLAGRMVSHTYCPVCLEACLAQMAQERQLGAGAYAASNA